MFTLNSKFIGILLTLSAIFATVNHAYAAEWYVAPYGRSIAEGTRKSPWDLESVLVGLQKVVPGDTVWLLGGTYKHPNRKFDLERGSDWKDVRSTGYIAKLRGRKGMPTLIRALPNKRVAKRCIWEIPDTLAQPENVM